MTINRFGSWLGLAALLAFLAWQLAGWNRRESRPPAWDQSVHLEIALDLRDALRTGNLSAFWRQSPKAGMPPFPPLYYISLLPFGGGAYPARALWANWCFLALLGVSIFGIGRRFMGEWRALAAVILFLCCPAIQGLYRSQLSDLALAAWVAAAYWALFESEGFRRLAPTALFSVAAAAAMLTKWSAFSYLLPVLWPFARALRVSPNRRNALACAALAALLFLPWYLDQWLVLLPRLVQASADNAVPVWRSGAAFNYLIQMAGGLDFPFFLLSVAALVPAMRRGGEGKWLLLLWFAVSYGFWTVVPNRQLRYLLPGLPPLALFCAGLWPRPLMIGLCAFQLFSAANFDRGWVQPIVRRAGIPISFFCGLKPAREDWKLEEILRAAEEARDKERPFANITLVANHESFNGPTFDWAVREGDFKTLHVRGVNKRICEFSEFLLVKTGSLGPAYVVNQLPDVQRLVLDPGGWFQAGWRELRRFPLPDGSDAVLFKQRKLAKAPFREQKAHFDYYEEGGVTARDLSIDFGRFDAARGVYPLVRLSAKELRIRGLSIDGLAAEMEDLALLPAEDEGERGSLRRSGRRADIQAAHLMGCRFLRMKALRIDSAVVRRESLAAFLKSRIPGLREESADMQNGLLSASGRLRGARISAAVSLSLSDDRRSLRIELAGLTIVGVPVPVMIFGRHARFIRSFTPDPELPFEIVVPGISLSSGRLLI